MRLPAYQNSISSLAVAGDNIIGGTSAAKGLNPYFFTASLRERKVTGIQELKVPGGQQAVRSGFCRGKNHELYAGTMPDVSGQGGHLIRLTLDEKGALSLKDLGVPVQGEGIYTLLADASGNILYGISFPSGLFFAYDINTSRTRIYREIMPSSKEMDALRLYILSPSDYLCQALIQDNDGMVYGSLPVNKIFYFDTKNERFHILKDSLPEVWGRKMLGRVDAWAKSADGKIYGGNAGDGQLFVIDPSTKNVKNLGKPIMMNRLRALTFGRDGKLYGIAGAPPGYTHLFSYDEKRGYQDYGNPQFQMVAPGIEQGIGWRGYNIATMVSSEDGNYIVMGEDEALSQLLIYIVPEE